MFKRFEKKPNGDDEAVRASDGGLPHTVTYTVDTEPFGPDAPKGCLRVHTAPDDESPVAGTVPCGTNVAALHLVPPSAGISAVFRATSGGKGKEKEAAKQLEVVAARCEWVFVRSPVRGYARRWTPKNVLQRKKYSGAVVSRGSLLRPSDEGHWEIVAPFSQGVSAHVQQAAFTTASTVVPLHETPPKIKKPARNALPPTNKYANHEAEKATNVRVLPKKLASKDADSSATNYEILSDTPDTATYMLACGNPNIDYAIRKEPSRTAPKVRELPDGGTIEATHRLSVRANNGETLEWLRIVAPVKGYVIFTLLDSYRRHVDRAARDRGCLWKPHGASKAAAPSASNYEILSDTPDAATYMLACGNPRIDYAIRGSPSRAMSEIHKLPDGGTIEATHRLSVRANNGETLEWLRIVAPVKGYVIFTLLDIYRQYVGQAARDRGCVWQRVHRAGVSAFSTANDEQPYVYPPSAVAEVCGAARIVQPPLPQSVFSVEECPICFWAPPKPQPPTADGSCGGAEEGNGDRFLFTLQCGHQLCTACGVTLARRRPQCPMCRTALGAAEVRALLRGATNAFAAPPPAITDHTGDDWSLEGARALVRAAWRTEEGGEAGTRRLMLRGADGSEVASNITASGDARISVSPGMAIVVNGSQIDTSQGCSQQ